MSEEKTKQTIRKAFDAVQSQDIPDFDSVWLAAEHRHKASRRRYAAFGSIAAAVAVIAIAVGNWSAQTPETGDDFLIADSLMNSTLWSAPSDALMPHHQFDIYQEIPFLDESTELQEGSLL